MGHEFTHDDFCLLIASQRPFLNMQGISLRAGRSALEIFSRKGYLILGIFGFPLDNVMHFRLHTLVLFFSRLFFPLIILLSFNRASSFTRASSLPAFFFFTRASSFTLYFHLPALFLRQRLFPSPLPVRPIFRPLPLFISPVPVSVIRVYFSRTALFIRRSPFDHIPSALYLHSGGYFC
jgi:hypothetical protein